MGSLPHVNNPYGDFLGIEIIEVKDGTCRAVLNIEEKHKNPNGVIHGGVIYSLIDDTMGAALYSLTRKTNHATIDIFVQYTGNCKEGKLHCLTEVVMLKKTVAFLRSEVTDSEGKKIALATGSFRIF